MDALLVILWFVGLLISIFFVFQLVGFSGIVNMFPGGRRSWHLPSQLFSLACFAGIVLINPFWGPMAS